MSRERDLKDARVACTAWLREFYPGVDWDTIDDLGRALNWEIHFGPMPPGYWTDTDPLTVPWTGFVDGCRRVSDAIAGLPVNLYYDVDAGCVLGERDPWDDPDNWGEEPDANFETERFYAGPNDYLDMPTIEVLFAKELWRYLT